MTTMNRILSIILLSGILLISNSVIAETETDKRKIGNWEVWTSIDDFDDSMTRHAKVLAPGEFYSVISFFCALPEKGLSALFFLSSLEDLLLGNTALTYRVDKNKTITVYDYAQGGAVGIFTNKATLKELISELSNESAQTLLIRIRGATGYSKTIKFDVIGAKESLDWALSSCLA